MTVLNWVSADGVALTDALHAAALPETAIGMVSTTAWHGFVTLHGTVLRTAADTVDPATVFDARFFAPGPVELRWVHDDGGQGRAVLLAQDLDAHSAPFGTPRTQEMIGTVEQTMLLWGTRSTGSTSGWTTLREHRIGTLSVPGLPAPPSAEHRAALRVREYLAEDEFGNAYVADELLLGLAWQPTMTWPEKESVA